MATGLTLGFSLTVLLGFLYLTQGELALDCCLKVSNIEIPRQIVRGYSHQTRDKGCKISALIFITRKGRQLCAPPDAPWAEDLVSNLDRQLENCKINKRMTKRCKSLKF